MKRADARNLYQMMLAVWPAAKSQHGPDTANVWLEYLETVEADDAQSAATEQRVSSEWFPSIAAFQASVFEHRTVRLGCAPKELEADIDATGLSKVRALVAWLKQGHPVITAKELDAGGVPHWRARLADARESDDLLGLRVNYDKAWSLVRQDLTRPPLILPDGRTFQ